MRKLVPAFSRYQWLIIALITIGTAWRMFFLLDTSIWSGLVDGTANSAGQGWLVFFVAFYISAIVSAGLIKNGKFKAPLIVLIALSLILPLSMRLIPVLQSYYVIYALFGLVTGAFQIPFIYYGALEFSHEIRAPAIAIFMFGFWAIVYLAMGLGRSISYDLVLGALSLLLLIALALSWRLKPLKLPAQSGKGAVSLKLVVTTGLSLSIGYFLSYLAENEMHVRILEDQGMAWIGQVIRLLVCLVFVFVGLRIKIFQLIYITLVATALTYALSILHVAQDLPAYFLFHISGTLLILTFFTLATAIIARYPKRPAVLAFLIFCGGIGNILGNTTGTAISIFLNGNPGLFYGLPVIIFVTAFTMIPLLLRSVKEEADLDSEPGSPAVSGKLAMPVISAQVISDRFITLNDHFDKENQLTGREREIAALLFERYDYETISNRLLLSVNTIKVHIKNIYRKYDITSRKELIDFVREKERAGA